MATTLAKLKITSEKTKKLTRAERNEAVKLRLFQAAAKIVGQYGYGETSVGRITDLAGCGQGTFYHHFNNRQEMLDNLLPVLGQQMVIFIQDRVDRSATESEKEIARFRAFFEYLEEVPEFLRILNEAESFAPQGYQKHLQTIAADYANILRKGRSSDTRLSTYSDGELEAVVQILLGARSYLGQRFAHHNGTVHPISDDVINAYVKLLNGGLFQSALPHRQ